ncbi:hypothetical protein FIM02_00540 [SAR202 cluster bacterium AD-802-E10_MRT_200m]|nr:hypothetical protein [SAR202 cluster bacterium AD-802-E10_MRT_200m]
MNLALMQEIYTLIKTFGKISFSQYMQCCLYSPRGGFFSSRGSSIARHFTTAPSSHPLYGFLIARQLEQMWVHLGEPQRFHVVEIGSGDGTLAVSILDALQQLSRKFANAVVYVAVDYEPRFPASLQGISGWHDQIGTTQSNYATKINHKIAFVKAESLRSLRGIVGCILSNELLDNFPVYRFEIRDKRAKEVFVTMHDERLVEILDEPSTPEIQYRLDSLSLDLSEGFRGEVNLNLKNWVDQIDQTLDRGFVLTIDYGDVAKKLYSSQYSQGTLVCYHQHAINTDPYVNVGMQDITSLVDFTSLICLSEQVGLRMIGYTVQRDFLLNLGFMEKYENVGTLNLSEAQVTLRRAVMEALIDPEQLGGFKVLVQSKAVDSTEALLGF